MLYFARANANVDLAIAIKGVGGPGATALFVLIDVNTPGTPVGTSPPAVSNWQVSVPGQPSGVMTSLSLETVAAFIGVTAADLFVDASQAGTVLPNKKPTTGRPTNWLASVTHQGVACLDPIFVYFV